jgi:hypothetical protein
MSNIKIKDIGYNAVLLFETDNLNTGSISLTENGFAVDGAVNARSIYPLVCNDTVIVPGSLSNVFALTLISNVSAININNLQIGSYIIIVKQDNVGSHTLSFGSNHNWKFIDGEAITITADANAIDIISIFYDGTNCYVTAGQNFTSL